MRLGILVCYLTALVACPDCFAQTSSDSRFEVARTESLVRLPQANFHSANFDVGELPSGAEGLIKLTVKNPTAEPFEFTKITRSCNCASIEADQNFIPAGGSTQFNVKLKTRKYATRKSILAVISLVDEKKQPNSPSVSIRMKYDLAGLVVIEPTMVSLEISPSNKFSELRLPLLITKPIKSEDLEFKVEEGLEGLNFEIEGEGDDLIARAFVPSEFVDSGPANGQVTIRDTVSSREDSVFVTIRKGTAYKISPSIIRFRKDKSKSQHESVDAYTGTVLIRLPRDSPSFQRTSEKKETVNKLDDRKEEIRVNAKLAGVRCDAQVTKLSTFVMKATLTIRLPKDRKEVNLADESQVIQWKLDDGRTTTSTSSRFVILR